MAYKGINGDLIFDDQFLAESQSLPTNTSADGNGGALQLGSTQNSINIVIKAKTLITVTATKVLSVSLSDSADNSTFASLGTVFTVTGATGDTTYAAGEEIAEITLPASTRKYVKAVITTTAATTGTIDIYPVYIAR